MPPRNKQRIYLALHHRGAISLAANRAKQGLAAYHWSILLTPKHSRGQDCFAYDATDSLPRDAAVSTPAHHPDTKLYGPWRFRCALVDPSSDPQLLGTVLLAKLAPGTGAAEVQALLAEVPLPRTGRAPEENCVSWAREAVQRLQGRGWVAKEVDVGRVMVAALERASAWLDVEENLEEAGGGYYVWTANGRR